MVECAFFLFHFSPLCSLSSRSQGFQCVNGFQSACVQARFCAGHVVSHTALITQLVRNGYLYMPFCCASLGIPSKPLSFIWMFLFCHDLTLSPASSVLPISFFTLTYSSRRSALQSLHKACEVARCHNYFPGSLFLTWVSYYQSRVSSDQVRINEWNIMQDVQSHRADSPVLFSDM